MRSRGLRVLIALVVLMVLALWLWRPGSPARAIDTNASVPAAQNPPIDLSPVASAREVVGSSSSSAANPASTPADERVLDFEFELTVIPIDGSGRLLQNVEVRVGLDMQALALLGNTEWNGEVHAKWRGSEPTVDLVLEARRDDEGCSTLRHVHLTASRAESLRLAIEKDSVPVPIEPDALRSGVREHESASNLDGGAEFKHNDGGTGAFVDSTLLRAPFHAENASSREFGEMIARASMESHMQIELAEMVHLELPKNPSTVDVTAVDELGAPIPRALITVLHPGGGGSGNAGPRGHLRLGSSSGPARVVVSDADHAVVWQDVDLEDGETRVLQVCCPKLERARLRLLDSEHHPLVGWHLESRDASAPGQYVDRGDTDARGHVAIVMDAAGPNELFARPAGASTLPKFRIDTRKLDRSADNDIVLDRPAQLTATILSADPAIEARLWNTDTDEGMRVPVVDGSKEEGGAPGCKIRADVLVPGTYVLEIGARCTQWKRVGPFRLGAGQALDAGTWTLDPPTTLKVIGIPPKDYVTLSARTRVQGLSLIGENNVSNTDDTLSLTPGEWTITIRSADGATPQRTFGPRVIEAESGRAITLDFGEVSEPH